MRTPKNIKSESGFAIVEFAMVAPMFVMIICFALEIGCYLMAATSLNGFTCAAAREYSQNPSATVYELAEKTNLAAPNLSAEKVNLTVSNAQDAKASYTHHFSDGSERDSVVTEQNACVMATFGYKPLTFVGYIMAGGKDILEMSAEAYVDVSNMTQEGLSAW